MSVKICSFTGRCAAVFLPLVLLSCTPADPIQRFSGPAQGSTYNISYWADSPINAAELQKQMVQEWIAQSYADMQAARLLTLQAAWKMDQLHAAGRPGSEARLDIAMIKFWGAKVMHEVIDRSIQVYGSLGYTTDMPLEWMYRRARAGRIYDGPDEVHKVTVARQVLKNYRASDVPTEHVPTRRKAAIEKFADYLDIAAVNS